MIIKKIPVRATFGSMNDKLRTAVENQLSDELNNPATLVDKLNVPFSETAPAVTCEPVEGYPLEVVSHINPIQEGSGNPSPGGYVESEWVYPKNDVNGDTQSFYSSTLSAGKTYRITVNATTDESEQIILAQSCLIYMESEYGQLDCDIVTVSDNHIDFVAALDGIAHIELYYENELDVSSMYDYYDEVCVYIFKDGAITLQEYIPANIRPISGHSSVKLWRGGKNILDTKNPKIYHNNAWDQTFNIALTDTGFRATAIRVANETWFRVGYLIGTAEELAGKTITVSCKYNSLVDMAENIPYLNIVETDIEPCRDNSNLVLNNGGYIGNTGSYNYLGTNGNPNERNISYTVTGNETKKYIAIMCLLTYGGSIAVGDWFEYSDIQVEIGDTPTSYEPYRGEEFTIDLGQDVYGGSFNWATGELTIDRKMITLDGSENWQEGNTDTSYNGKDNRKRSMLHTYNNSALLSEFGGSPSDVVDRKLICSVFPTVTGIDTWYNKEGISSQWSTNTHCLSFYSEQYATDFEGFKSAMLGAQIVFGLKEPITIQLTPQEILALSGTNTLYSDTGDTEVTGRVDPTAVFEKLTNAIVALGGTV